MMLNNNESPVNLKLALFAGSGIGLLFGMIIGTSITPTVATILGALTTLLAAILGLNDRHFNDAKAVRVGAFGFACVLGAYLGLFVRAHNVFSPSIITLKETYLEVGFSEQQALNFIAFKEFGITLATPETVIDVNESRALSTDDTNNEKHVTPTPVVELSRVNSHANKQHSSVLFSAPVELSGCDELAYSDNTLPLDELMNNFELTGGVWEDLSIALSDDYSDQEQKSLLLLVRDVACKVEDMPRYSCAGSILAFDKTSFSDVIASIKPEDQQWHTVINEIEQTHLSSAMKLSALILVNNVVCGA